MGGAVSGAPPLARRAPRAPGEPKVGPPHSFGWLRRAEFDAQSSPPGGHVYEKPNGSLVAVPPNADLVEVEPGVLQIC